MDVKTQRQRIVAYCRAHGYITCRDAVMIGINSPTKRLSELRSDPQFTVTTIDVPVFGDDGKRVSHYYRYVVKEVVKC